MMGVFTSDHFDTYQRCPKAYQYKYIKGIRFALKKDTYKLGRNIHSLVYYKLMGQPLDKIEHALDLETQKHWENISDNWLLSKKVVCAEWGFDVILGGEYFLNGRIDAVFQDDDGSYIIADWKTGESLPYSPEEKFQAMIYMYAFFKAQKDLGLDFTPARLRFVFVGSAQKGLEKEVTCSDEMISEIEEKLSNMVAEILSDTGFEANKKSCAFCEFQQICTY